MGKLFRDNYASTYVAKNVKQALDKLINVLQSREHVRRLVVGAQAPRKPSKHSCKGEAPAETPLWTPSSASMASNLDSSEKAASTSSVSENTSSSEKRKVGSCGGSRRSCSDSSSHIPTDSEKAASTSSVSENTSSSERKNTSTSERRKAGSCGGIRRSIDSFSHVPIEWYYQMWEKGLRDYGCDGTEQAPAPARYRQKSSVAPKVEAGWSSVPCKPGYLDVFEDTLLSTKLLELKGGSALERGP